MYFSFMTCASDDFGLCSFFRIDCQRGLMDYKFKINGVIMRWKFPKAVSGFHTHVHLPVSPVECNSAKDAREGPAELPENM